MGITDHWSAGDVVLDADVRNKDELLRVMGEKAAERAALPAEDVIDALRDREELGSTGIGRGIALPHAELPAVSAPVVLFARLRRPIDYESQDAERVDLVFVALWPAEGTKRLLDAMGDICRKLKEPSLARHLRSAGTADEVAQILRAA
jgi:PTS system nitrogen regulatory IIA component